MMITMRVDDDDAYGDKDDSDDDGDGDHSTRAIPANGQRCPALGSLPIASRSRDRPLPQLRQGALRPLAAPPLRPAPQLRQGAGSLAPFFERGASCAAPRVCRGTASQGCA